MKKIASIIFLLFIVSCSSLSPLEKAIKKYDYIEGYLAAKPVLDDKGRLFVNINTVDNSFVGVLRNKKESYIITQLFDNIKRSPRDQPIKWYGKKIKGIDEIIDGVDYEVFIISYYNSSYSRYLFVQVDYCRGTRENLQEIDMKKIFPILFDHAKKFF